MKSIEQIVKEAQMKANVLAEVSAQTNSSSDKKSLEKIDTSNLDAVAQSVIEQFLKEETASKKRKPKKRKNKKTSVEISKPKPKPIFRITFDFVKELYEKSGLKPFKTQYWFYDDIEKYPLIQASITNEDRTAATPIGALVLTKYKELLALEKPPSFLDYGDLEEPSNKWTAGRLSQVTGLSISYLLGFSSGYAGNGKPHPGCSKNYHLGFEDGDRIRLQMIENNLIEPDPVEDIYADEQDEHILSELVRVRKYVRV